MKKKLLYFSALAFVFVFTVAMSHAQNSTAPADDSFRSIAQDAFDVGEELNFDVNYGFVTAGKATMAIPRYSNMKGRQCYNIDFRVKTAPFFDNFYRVRDRYQSHIDVKGLFPWKFVQQIREGGYSRDFSAWFDNYQNKAFTTEGTYDVEPYTQDIVSAFYYMRTRNYDSFKKGDIVYLKNFYKDTTYTLTVRFLGRETIDVDAGEFRTIKLEPILEEGGLFKATGRIFVWLTDDDRKMPVLVEAEIPIGSIKGELTSYKGLTGPLHARIK